MAETKQITATIPVNLAEWVEKQPERGMVSFSKTIAILLNEAKDHRDKGFKPKKDWRTKYTK